MKKLLVLAIASLGINNVFSEEMDLSKLEEAVVDARTRCMKQLASPEAVAPSTIPECIEFWQLLKKGLMLSSLKADRHDAELTATYRMQKELMEGK